MEEFEEKFSDTKNDSDTNNFNNNFAKNDSDINNFNNSFCTFYTLVNIRQRMQSLYVELSLLQKSIKEDRFKSLLI